MSFLPLILNTAQTMTNDPKSKYFLPGVLANIPGDNTQGRLLPIEEHSWSIGAIGGVSGQTVTSAFEDNWMTYLEKVQKLKLNGQVAVPQPATPFPLLDLQNGQHQAIQIIGLQNVKVARVKVLESTDTGYHISLVLQLNQWSSLGYPALQINTPYTLRQSLCLANQGSTACNGNASTDIDGDGSAVVLIQNAAIEVDLHIGITGTGPARALAVTLNAVDLVGSTPGQSPVLSVQSLVINASVSSFLLDIWRSMATKAITSADGANGIFGQIDTALNTVDNLTTLSKIITGQLESLVNSMFGAVAAGALPTHAPAPGVNQVDQYLVDRAGYALNTEGSGWYLPQVLTGIDQPRLDPFDIASIPIPDFTIDPFGPVTAVAFSTVQVIGLSNLLTPAAQMRFQPNSLSFVATLGMLDPPPVFGGQQQQVPPPPTLLTANFTMTMMDTVVAGGITITLPRPSLAVAANSTGSNLDDLQLDIDSLAISVADPSHFVIAVEIDSAFAGIINEALNTATIRTQILSAVNEALGNSLDTISSAVTGEIKSLIAARLG